VMLDGNFTVTGEVGQGDIELQPSQCLTESLTQLLLVGVGQEPLFTELQGQAVLAPLSAQLLQMEVEVVGFTPEELLGLGLGKVVVREVEEDL